MLSALLISVLLAQADAPADSAPATAPAAAAEKTSAAKPADEKSSTAEKPADASSPKFEPSATPSKLSISGKMTLDEARAEIEKQTGNTIVDYRGRFNQQATNPKLTLDIQNAPFWPAMDVILDKTNLTIYAFSGKDGIALVERTENEIPRYKRPSSTYAGPLRMEVNRLVCERKPGIANSDTLKVNVEVAWEPRLVPITFVQPMKDVTATDDQGHELHFEVSETSLEVAVEGGTGVDLLLPFTAPPRSATKIALIKGTLHAIVTGKVESFEFGNLAAAKDAGFTPVEQKKDAAHVTLEQVRKNNEIWEVLIRVKYDEAGSSLQSHLNWISQNEATIVGPDKNPIEKAGFFITARNDKEVGIGYQFELPETGVEGCTFVYKSASSMREIPIPYELKDLALP